MGHNNNMERKIRYCKKYEITDFCIDGFGTGFWKETLSI
jgi:hypothetical protein